MIRNKVYISDVSAGVDSIDEALELKEDLKTAIGMGGFDLAKWKSSHPRNLEVEEIPKPKIIGGNTKESTKVLGVEWRMEEDVFTFNFNDESLKREVKTTRDIVSVQAWLYNPLGFILPFLLIGRRLLQCSLAGNASWDSPLHESLHIEFQKWQVSILLLARYKIPR